MFGGDDEQKEIPPEEKPERIRELLDALPAEASDEATELVEETDDADEVIEGLERIIAAHSPDSTDEAVNKAESVAHLERMLAADGSITSWVESRVEMLTGTETAQLRDAIDGIPPEIESDADERVRRAETADSLRAELEELTEEFHEQEANSAVSGADSLADLKATLGDDEEDEDDQEEPESDNPVFDTIRQRTGEGIQGAQEMIKNAEPHEAAVWGLVAGAAVMNPAFGAPAIAAETSTAALVGVSALSGGAIGTYASGNEELALNDVDPTELFNSAEQMTAKTQDIDQIDGRALGVFLGASSHLAEVLAPDDYAQWVTNADTEAILDGAELGAQHAQDDSLGMSSRGGAAVGAGLGLLYSYVESGDADDELQDVLDEDLWAEYRVSLEEGE
jgi:hypothetical protein